MTPSKDTLAGVQDGSAVLSSVSFLKETLDESYNRQESMVLGAARKQDFDITDQLKLAHRALVLVDKGASEQSSVHQATISDPRLTGLRREALALVLGTVREQNLLDLYVQNAFPDDKLGISDRCLFRLTTYTFLRLKSKRMIRRLEGSLKAIVPPVLLPKLELFLGTLPAYDESRFFFNLGDSEKVALETQHAVWWVDYCFRMLGRSDAVRLLSSPPRPRYLRVNPLRNRGRTSLPRVLGPLVERLTRVPSTPRMYTVRGPLSAFAEFFKDGLFQMQDLASYLAVTAGAPEPRETVLDLCAAPGAKTAAIAQLMRNRGEIVSVDYSPVRMKSWKREVKRLGVQIAYPVIGDAARIGLRENFDLVIVDPPCTGTGVFDRNPRMKWHLSAQSVDRYSILQRRFLESAASIVDAHGRILYCTCSLTIEENEDVVSTFLKSHPGFETRPVLEQFGSPGLRGMTDCRRFYPHRDQTAGYFIARIECAN